MEDLFRDDEKPLHGLIYKVHAYDVTNTPEYHIQDLINLSYQIGDVPTYFTQPDKTILFLADSQYYDEAFEQGIDAPSRLVRSPSGRAFRDKVLKALGLRLRDGEYGYLLYQKRPKFLK